MTSAQVVETSVNVISNSPSQDYTHPDVRTLLYDMTPGFKPFTNIDMFCAYVSKDPRGGFEVRNDLICLKLGLKIMG